MNYILFEKGEVPCEFTMSFCKPSDEKESGPVTHNSLYITLKYFNVQTTLELNKRDLRTLKQYDRKGIMNTKQTIMHMIDTCRKKMEEDGTQPPISDMKKYANEIYKRVEDTAKELDKFIGKV